MKPGKRLGAGKTAEVYEYGENKVIKLFHHHMALENILQEYELSQLINSLGIPSPSVDGLLNVSNKWGIIFEKIEGRSLTAQLLSGHLKIAQLGLCRGSALQTLFLKLCFHIKRNKRFLIFSYICQIVLLFVMVTIITIM